MLETDSRLLDDMNFTFCTLRRASSSGSVTSDSTSSGRTTLTGRANDPVFEIDTASATSQVTLRHLTIEGVAGGEEGVLIEGSSTVTIENSQITNHDAGGVVAVSGANVSIDLNQKVSFVIDADGRVLVDMRAPAAKEANLEKGLEACLQPDGEQKEPAGRHDGEKPGHTLVLRTCNLPL